MSQETLSSARTDLFYRKMGSGPAIVLLHGFPESGSLWRYVWDDLSANATVIIPDLPGSGNSPLEGGCSIADMAASVKAILDGEQITRAVIAGHSMGGYVALAFAAMYPSAVAGLSLVHSTPVADDDEKKENRMKVIELVRKGGREAFLKQMVPNLFASTFKLASPELVNEQVTNALAMDADSLINFYTAMMERPDRTALLDNAGFAVQWIFGAGDTLIPISKVAQFCYRTAVNFVSYYDDCGHMSMVEAPDKLAGDLKQFVDYCY